MNKILMFLLFLLFFTFSTNAHTNKEPAPKLNWGAEETNGCIGRFCIETELSKTNRDMFERIDKSNRMRRTDPFSKNNSDNGNDGAEYPRAGFSFSLD